MQRIMNTLSRQRTSLFAALLVTALSLLLVLPVQAEPQPVALKDGLDQSQIYNGDLEVNSRQVLEGDIVVYAGDVKIESGGRIAGTLTVYSGDIEIEEEGRVDGDITSWSGDIDVNGQVGGSISSMSGNVEVGDTGTVGGSISVLSGEITQRAGASVGGNVLSGPALNLPSAPGVNIDLMPWLEEPDSPELGDAVQVTERDRWGLGPLGFVARAVGALLLLGLFVGGAAAVAALRPAWSAEMHGVLVRQPALAFASGLIANVLMLAVIGFLYITVCLRPPGLLLGLGLLAFNIAGMAAVGAEIGGRASERMSGRWTPTARTALGVVLPGVFIAFMWTLGGCFGFFASAGALLISSFGVGTILVKALNLGAGTPPVTPARAAETAPAPTPAAPPPGAPVESSPVESSPVESTPVDASPVATAPVESTPIETVAVEPAPAESAPLEAVSTATAAVESAPVEPTPQEPVAVESAPVEPAPAEAEAGAAAAAAPWWQDEVTAAAAAAEPPPAAAAPPAVFADRPPLAKDDFTLIEGLGPKLSQRLHAANILTFVDLAALPPETLAGLLGWTSERVLRSGVQDRARRLAVE